MFKYKRIEVEIDGVTKVRINNADGEGRIRTVYVSILKDLEVLSDLGINKEQQVVIFKAIKELREKDDYTFCKIIEL